MSVDRMDLIGLKGVEFFGVNDKYIGVRIEGRLRCGRLSMGRLAIAVEPRFYQLHYLLNQTDVYCGLRQGDVRECSFVYE